MGTVSNGPSTSARAQGVLARNLAALDRVDPRLADRIRLPVDGSRTRWDASGALVHRLHRTWVSLEISDDDVESSVESVAGASSVIVLGIGKGELVTRLLHTSRPIFAWEHDPWILRIFLTVVDVAEAISSERLTLSLGIDLLDFERDRLGLAEVEHPVLAAIYASEIRLVRGSLSSSRAVMCAGGLFVEEVRDALEAGGRSTWTLDIQGLAEEEIALTMKRFAPELVVAINYTDGLVEFCATHRTKLIVWEIDPSTTPPRPVTGEVGHAFVFTFRAAHVEVFRGIGLEHVEYLPLAADVELRKPLDLDAPERDRLFAPVAHVGSSLVENAQACRERVLAAWREWSPSSSPRENAATLDRILADQRADFARFRVPELLESLAPGFRAAALSEPGSEDPVVLVGEIAGSEKRLSWAANLGRLGLSVWGDAGWRATEEHGVRFRGPAGHRVELTRIYAACPLHWDVGRIYQSDIVTMRVFDVLACGRLVLAEHSAALEASFDVGTEVQSYRDVRELTAKTAYYIEHPEEAQRIGQAGREAVVARHTIRARVAHMLGRA